MAEPRSIPARALAWITWGLTFHILAVAVLFGLFRLPAGVVRGIAAWKEIAAALLFVAVVARAVTGRGPRVSVTATDLCVGGWIALTVVYFVTENVVWRDSIPIKAALFGLRDACYFVLFYFVGRATPEIVRDDRWMKRAFTVLLITSGLAILEQIFITPQMLVVLGVASYVRDFLGTAVYTTNNVYGLPSNYWSQMGSHLVWRSGSVFLSSQAFAVIFVILLPQATLWVLERRDRARAWANVGYAVIWSGLLVTYTRAAIAVGVLQLGLILGARRRVTGIALAAAMGLGVLIAAMIAVPGLATFIIDTLTWQTGSSASHVKDWTAGITAFLEQPWGYGLGTADIAAVRGGLEPIVADNLYLDFAVQTGVLGLALLVATLTFFAATASRLARTGATTEERELGTSVLLSTVGVALYGMTSVMLGDPMVSYLLFWFAGMAVTVAQRAPDAIPRALRASYA